MPHLNYEMITALCATLIGLAALVVSVWQGIVARRHSRLSVTPYLRFDWHFNPGKEVRLDLVNCGIGPAVIDDIHFEVDSKLIDGIGFSILRGVLSAIGLENPKWTYHWPNPGEAMSAGERHKVLRLTDLSEADYKVLIEAFPRLSVKARYRSIYGEKFTAENSMTFRNKYRVLNARSPITVLAESSAKDIKQGLAGDLIQTTNSLSDA